MLALATGWTPDVLGDLPITFRSACHWALYVRALAGEEGLPNVSIPTGGAVADRQAAMRLSVEVAKLREAVFPDDADE